MHKLASALTALATAAALAFVPVAGAEASGPPQFQEVVAFATKTGFRIVVAWEADQPVAGRVRYGPSPTNLPWTAQAIPGGPDTAQMAVLNLFAGFDPEPGETVYFKVEDALSGAATPVQSVESVNAYNDWNGSTYTIDLVVQLDSESLPPEVPGDVALREIAAGVNVFAERVYDALDGYARIGNVLITDTELDYSPNVPFLTLEPNCLTDTSNMADVLVETAPPLDSHTFAGWAVSQYCTQFYIGRVGWLGSHWLDDLSLGYVMAHEGMHYWFNTPDLYDGGADCRNLAWDGSLMHNTGGWNGSRWELTELDRNPTLTPCDHGNEPWSWAALRQRYTNVPENPNGPIDHVVDALPRGNADGGALNIMILDRQPGGSTLTAYTPDDSFDPFVPGSFRKHYVGGTGDVLAFCGGWMNPGIGGACFEVPAGLPSGATATITVDDEAGWDVGASFRFEDANQNPLASGFLCGSGTTTVPPNAALLVIFFGEARGPVRCLNAGEVSPGAATQGTVTVHFA